VDSPSHFHSSWRLSLNQSLMGGVLERRVVTAIAFSPRLDHMHITFYRHQMMELVKSGRVDIPTVVCKFMCQSLLLRLFSFCLEKNEKKYRGLWCRLSKEIKGHLVSVLGSGAVNLFIFNHYWWSSSKLSRIGNCVEFWRFESQIN